MMNAMRFRSLMLAAIVGCAGAPALAQPFPDRPAALPAPRAVPLRPSVAQPPLPAQPPGTLIESPKGIEAEAREERPTRWQDALNQLDSDLRLRLLTANEPPTAWLAGELDTTDIQLQVHHYADARIAAPQEPLYQASLATACLVRVRPQLAPCEAVDRLADWARRDTDNGVPSVLLAERARERGEPDEAASHVEAAAAARRFDDYWSRGALAWWNYLRPLPMDVDPAVKAKAAANYASRHELAWTASLRGLCAEAGQRSDRMKAACAKLGEAMMTRGATFALQRAGASIAEMNAMEPATRAAAQSGRARIIEATARCAQAQPDFATELESPVASTRAQGVEQFGAWAGAQARDGEVGACARLVAGK